MSTWSLNSFLKIAAFAFTLFLARNASLIPWGRVRERIHLTPRLPDSYSCHKTLLKKKLRDREAFWLKGHGNTRSS